MLQDFSSNEREELSRSNLPQEPPDEKIYFKSLESYLPFNNCEKQKQSKPIDDAISKLKAARKVRRPVEKPSTREMIARKVNKFFA
jgi:hypothetical protein